MSMFDNQEKDDFYDAIEEFLENHSIYELMYIITTAIEYHENRETN